MLHHKPGRRPDWDVGRGLPGSQTRAPSPTLGQNWGEKDRTKARMPGLTQPLIPLPDVDIRTVAEVGQALILVLHCLLAGLFPRLSFLFCSLPEDH